MCDQDSINDMLAIERSNSMSRRRFGMMSVAASLVSWADMVRATDALPVSEQDVVIETTAGHVDAYFVHPAKGSFPGVLIWPDAFGLRPAFRQMARRLAESGYAVLVPNPFYRSERAPVFPAGASFSDPDTRDKVMSLMAALTPDVQFMDAKSMVGWLDAQPHVSKQHKLGTMGYCMGGAYTFRTAASFPERVGAAASFHGGGLVTDKAESPHLLVPKLKAHYLIAIAANDDDKQPDAKDTLRAAFAAANVPAEIEVYAGTMHGWCPPDAAVYNEVQAERAWARLLVLFKQTL